MAAGEEFGLTTELAIHTEQALISLQMEVDMGCRIDPVIDLVEIGQCAGASRDQLLRLTLWLATSMTGRQDDVGMVPGNFRPTRARSPGPQSG
jgi:hypothetical protein